MAELALRPGYLTPRNLPHGDCIATDLGDDTIRIDRADPQVLISAELLDLIIEDPSPRATVDTAGCTDSYAGAVLRLNGVNRTVVYRMVEYVPAVHGYIGEWPD